MRKGLTALAVCALLVALFAQTAQAAAPDTCPCTPCHKVVHIVRWGENLWRISRWYGTTVEAIACANGIVNPHCIYAGDRLVIPCGHPHHGCHPGPCPPCNKPCPDGNVSCPDCPDPCPGENEPCPGDDEPCPGDNEPCPDCKDPCCHGRPHCGWHHPRHGGFHYTVRWGDTLSGIAWRFGVNMWSIVHANRIANPNCIYAGQRLYIP